MNTPPPLANAHFPKQLVIGAKRRKYRKLVEVLCDVDDTLGPPSPSDDEATFRAGADCPDVRGISSHLHALRLRRAHSARNNATFARAHAIA
jgi:hypothetical protein